MPEIYIISGFLGVGKTTLIEGVVQSTQEPFFLIENEAGDKAIDGNQISKKGQIQVVNLLSGCICCSLLEEFKQTLKDHQDEEIILVEPTGIAQVSKIRTGLKEFPSLYVVTIVDPVDVLSHEEDCGSYYQDQIQSADTVIINVRGNCDTSQAEQVVNQLNPFARLYSLDLSQVCLSRKDLRFASKNHLIQDQQNLDPLQVETVMIEGADFADREALQASVYTSLVDLKVRRVKGHARVSDQTYKIDYASGRWSYTPVDHGELGLVVIWG